MNTCTKTFKRSTLPATSLINDDADLFNDNEYVTDADGNVFDKNGKFVGYTWEAVRDELTRKMSEAYGVDFFKVTRMREAGLLKDRDVTNELLLSPEFKYMPYPGFKPTPPQKPVHRDPEWQSAIEEMIAAFENDDDDDDVFEDELGNKYPIREIQ